jgi:hypothetical protein
MKANKVTVTIKMESLSIDVLAGMLQKVIHQVQNECENGTLTASDGDTIEWKTDRKEVSF